VVEIVPPGVNSPEITGVRVLEIDSNIIPVEDDAFWPDPAELVAVTRTRA
jgi:hypothetical protein